MRTFLEEYGGAIVTFVIIIALIGVVIAVINKVAPDAFTNLINNFFNNAQEKAGQGLSYGPVFFLHR